PAVVAPSVGKAHHAGHDLVRDLDGGQATVTSAAGAVTAPVEVSDEIMPGVVSLPHGWGHDRGAGWAVATEHAGVSVNDLTDPTHVEPIAGNAVLNGVPVTVTAVASG
ncbi:MAG: molybdopterin dinucleotide binding domain-containing protein, partial [Myxococcota bacterium]